MTNRHSLVQQALQGGVNVLQVEIPNLTWRHGHRIELRRVPGQNVVELESCWESYTTSLVHSHRHRYTDHELHYEG